MATVLILDDHAPNREFLSVLLGYVGHTLLEAGDALTALEITRARRPDLVIADVLMPVVDGFEFVRRLRADPAMSGTRVMFYTAAYLESEARALADACGVAYLLTKPAEPQEIIATVQAALRAPAAPVQVSDNQFDRDHQRLLLDKLSQKVDELEHLNADLERRVAARTAELNEANSRLRELNAFKDNLLAITSHDLRSPLGAIQNITEILLEDEVLSVEQRRLMGGIQRSVHGLIVMVSKLLDLSRLEAGKVVLEPIDLRVSEVAHHALDSLQASAESKRIAVDLVVEPGEPTITADWLRLSQVIGNLLSNAVKFTPPGGRIIVTAGPADGGAFVRVADTGVGIPEEALPHLFDKFWQAQVRGTADEPGSGLGLAIVRQLVQLHRGTITVSSQPAAGSTFTVTLPASAE